MRKINEEIAMDIISQMSEEKKELLRKALTRNLLLTGCRILENGTISVYKEGFYLQFKGCRCGFAVWAWDNDSELIFGRKPSESKLHKIYDDSIYIDESFFDKILTYKIHHATI